MGIFDKNVLGNSFDQGSMSIGHARKVWREIREVLPAGGVITNVSDFTAAGVIPAGSPVAYDDDAKTMKVITSAALTAAEDASTLGINGYLQEDVVVKDASTVATGTVVADGDIYGFMFGDNLAKLKGLAQTNGLKIRFVN